MRKAPGDPLIYFLLAGGLLFLAQQAISRLDRPRIVVDQARIDTLVLQREGQQMRTLPPADRQALVDEWVADEILFREALRRGLEQDDRIRRALVLKMRSQITGELSPPSEDALRAWFDERRDRYRGPDGQPAGFEAVRPYLPGDWLMEQSRRAVDEEVARLRNDYEIVIDGR